MLRPLIGVRIRDYFRNIYVRVLVVATLSVIVPFAVYENMDGTVLRFFAVCTVCVLSVGTVAYTIGLSGNERIFVRTKAVGMARKIFKK